MVGSSGKAALSSAGFSPYSADEAGLLLNQRLAAALRERYAFERPIGGGGAAYVYLARDLRDDRLVAVKALRPDFAGPLAKARFRREIEIASELQHENILPLLDFGSVDELIYFTMPYVEGGTLRTKITKEKQLQLGEAISITRDIASALDYAHMNGVVHRDIKPGNILLDGKRVLVADFGIARAMTAASGDEITTHSGLAIGTPEYMSPEQGSGRRDLDARCDIYALGCVLFEMLAGEPPFTGPTAQAVIARHCLQPPPSIRVIRGAVPSGVERAIGKALAKVPADRYSTAREFVEELDAGVLAGDHIGLLTRFSSRPRVLLFAAITALAGYGLWYAQQPAQPVPDPNRIVVFPLTDQAAVRADGSGEAVATFIGYALDGTKPLKWLDGWELLDDSQRSRTARLDSRQAARLSAGARAGYYVDGSILRGLDSTTVILRLFSVTGDSVVRIAGRSGPTPSASLPQLGLDAIGELLPALVAPGGRIDLSTLRNRRPTAVANFLQGEREYRRMQFENALQHYNLAMKDDSAFTLAASRGAYAATWLSEPETGLLLAEGALRQRESLSPAQALLTEGLRAYLTGRADSAVGYLRESIKLDPTVHGGWTLLGEVYARMLPSDGPGDSLARDALERGRRADSDFAPTLLLLEEIALRAGNVGEVARLREELKRAGADTTHQASRQLMLRCVRDGPSSVDWKSELSRDAMSVVSSGKILAGGASQPECAIAIFRAVVHADSVTTNARWGAFLGLQAQLAAVNRRADAAHEFAAKEMVSLPVPLAYLLVASAGAGFEREAIAVADSGARAYETSSAPALWHFGTWEAHRKNATRLRAIVRLLQHRADSSGSRRDLLLSRAITARLRLVQGDSAEALQILRTLTPSAPRVGITWQHWESLGPERLALAELLFARGAFEEARKVATQLEATGPVIYPLYLRQSLELRKRIADALRDDGLAADYGDRIRRLRLKHAQVLG